jgi:hypothetical protein
MENKKVCCKTVATQSGWKFRPCSKPVVKEVEGKCYCKIHDPEYVAAKNKARQEKWDKEWASKRVQLYGQTLLSALEIVSNKISDNAIRSIQDCGELGVYLNIAEIRTIRAAIAKARGQI